jgi:hypothetical protein
VLSHPLGADQYFWMCIPSVFDAHDVSSLL